MSSVHCAIYIICQDETQYKIIMHDLKQQKSKRMEVYIIHQQFTGLKERSSELS